MMVASCLSPIELRERGGIRSCQRRSYERARWPSTCSVRRESEPLNQMRTPEHVWLVVEKGKVVRGEMPSGDPSVYSVPTGIAANEAVEQMTSDNWQVSLHENSDSAGNYRIQLVRDRPPE